MKIVLLDGYDLNQDLNWETLKNLGDFEFYSRTSVDSDTEILQRIDDAEVVITHKTPLDESVISRASQLKYIGIMGTGYDVVDIDSANNHNIIVTNVPTYATDAVAQFTFSLLLEITGQVGLHNQLVHDGKWSSVDDFTFWDKPLFELKGKTLGLIGYGRIAQKVAELANAFSMKVIFYNHRPSVATQKRVTQVSLDELFQKADIISLHAVQTPETINLINKTTISKMKDGVILINTARGKLISENDMAEALNNEKVYALATDVVQKEPIEKDNPLLKAKNCFITPHIAWAPLETRERLLRITVDNLNAYLSGEAQNVIS